MANRSRKNRWLAGGAGILAAAAVTAHADTDVRYAPLLDRLMSKGILTQKEADNIKAAIRTNNVSVPLSQWRVNQTIKNLTLFGDLRFRYEYRGTSVPVIPGVTPSDRYYRERMRYALRAGIRGDLFDNFYYGFRVETSANPRSPWVTFGDDSSPTPFSKASDTLQIGQIYLGWKPVDWYEMTVGKMPNPLYTTPMVWDLDLNPEGAVEKFKYLHGDLTVFANFGQFLYEDSNPDTQRPTSDTFLLAQQIGVEYHFNKSMSVKAAPVLYIYAGNGTTNGTLASTFIGQGSGGLNQAGSSFVFNQSGLDNLAIIDVPAEFNFKIGGLNAKGFADFAINLDGNERAEAAFKAAPAAFPGIKSAATGQNIAYQAGFAIGNNLGLVYGTTSKKGTWEARAYYQHVEQYALDVNLIDSDFFEGRGNLEGIYGAISYSFTDDIIGTARYGYARQIDRALNGTGGSNSDLAFVNPIDNYSLLQLDVTWRF
jgi:Putative porin